jgi:hypothetical protein
MALSFLVWIITIFLLRMALRQKFKKGQNAI